MKQFLLSLLAVLITIHIISCGAQDSEAIKPWTESEKKDFREQCFFSTRFSLEQMGIKTTPEKISSICDCTASSIENEYNYKAANRIPKAKVHEIFSEAMLKCAPDLMSMQPVDSTQSKN